MSGKQEAPREKAQKVDVSEKKCSANRPRNKQKRFRRNRKDNKSKNDAEGLVTGQQKRQRRIIGE